MFLLPNDRKPRAHSRSRSRSRSTSRAPKAPSPPSTEDQPSKYAYPVDPPSGSAYGNSTGRESSYEVRSPGDDPRDRVPYPSESGQRSVTPTPYPADNNDFTMGGWTDYPPSERPGYVQPPDERQYAGRHPDDSDDDLAYGMPATASREGSRQPSYSSAYPQQPSYTAKPQEPSSIKYRYTPQPTSGGPQYSSNSYDPPQQYQYAPQPEQITYTKKPVTSQEYTQTPQQNSRQSLPRTYSQTKSSSSKDARVVEIRPDTLEPEPTEPSSSYIARIGSSNGPLECQRRQAGSQRPWWQPPPPSPLLEAYHGTYQQLSPMPSAVRFDDDSELDDLAPLSPNNRRNDKLALEAASKKSRRVVIYDPEADATKLASSLNSRKPSADPICDVLPPLSHDQILLLRKEYKKQVRVQGKGINLSKHLKLKFGGSNFGKAAHVTSLGRWESEGYWANFWYQSHSSRRELLIESLMGRSNAEIREIKDSFKDKRYSDSLTRCMEKELKMDKFRTAVLMVLEERRQEEQDVYPPEYRDRDVDTLAKSIRAREGGETAMLDIIVRRSDAHLREVLRAYQDLYGENFARAALQKSGNLVGEVIAHILNGVINKPARDALLLHHAIKDVGERNQADELRYELLISRLVRLHWDRALLGRVKRAYRDKYGRPLEEDLEDATKGDLREFVWELART
ncbi:hypothetical protein Q7P37_006397 [Cladosporium fusiforme]